MEVGPRRLRQAEICCDDGRTYIDYSHKAYDAQEQLEEIGGQIGLHLFDMTGWLWEDGDEDEKGWLVLAPSHFV